MKKILFVAIILALLTGGWLFLKKQSAERQVQNAKQKMITEAKAALLLALKDPASVQFRQEIIHSSRSTVCGEVNAKNSLGGYVGFKRFVAKPGQFAVEGGSLTGWKMADNPVEAPDYMPDVLDMIEKGQLSRATAFERSNAEALTEETFQWLWKTNCEATQ